MKMLFSALIVAAIVAPVWGADEKWLEQAVFTKRLNDDKSAAEPTEAFGPADTVHLSLELKGRPKKGVVRAKFLFRDEIINEAKVDLSKESLPDDPGVNVFVAFSLKPKEPFPVSAQYRVETMLDTIPLGTFRFRVDPPADAIASRIEKTVLVKEMPEDLAEAGDAAAFASDDVVILAGVADLGKLSWLQAEWFINGRRTDEATQTLAYEENKQASVFHFKHRPEGGWKPGRHEVALLLNGKEVARKLFSVRAAADVTAPEAGKTMPVLRKATLHRDNGHGRAAEPVDAFTRQDRILHFVCDLENAVAGASGQITWSIIEADGGLKDIVMARAPLTARIANRLAGRFTAARELPKGKYRVEITVQNRELASREFEVR
jgi:hypothetical protein